jgi:DNA-binding MarR family transcriptional regulator
MLPAMRRRTAPGPTLQAAQDGSFGHLLFTCARLLDELAQAEVNRAAGTRRARPALMRLLPFLDFEGIRPTELARRVDVSKQAIGKALAELEAQGLVERVADPGDARALLVRLTVAGGAAFAESLEVLALFEGELARRLGAGVVRSTFDGLRKMRGVLELWQGGGAPRRPLPAGRPARPGRHSRISDRAPVPPAPAPAAPLRPAPRPAQRPR